MASPFGAAIICGPVGVGGILGSSDQLKEAPNVFVSIVTLMSWPAGPVLLGGVSVGVAHCVTASFFSQADRIVSATPAQIIPVSIFICFLCLCDEPFVHGLTLREEGQVELRELPNRLSAGGILPAR